MAHGDVSSLSPGHPAALPPSICETLSSISLIFLTPVLQLEGYACFFFLLRKCTTCHIPKLVSPPSESLSWPTVSEFPERWTVTALSPYPVMAVQTADTQSDQISSPLIFLLPLNGSLSLFL